MTGGITNVDKIAKLRAMLDNYKEQLDIYDARLELMAVLAVFKTDVLKYKKAVGAD